MNYNFLILETKVFILFPPKKNTWMHIWYIHNVFIFTKHIHFLIFISVHMNTLFAYTVKPAYFSNGSELLSICVKYQTKPVSNHFYLKHAHIIYKTLIFSCWIEYLWSYRCLFFLCGQKFRIEVGGATADILASTTVRWQR